ncbi:hypothetical protein BJ322DRAFT_1219491 [Thelephora terrestris]|uniref:F-box domain-containing protein n=1 Tax=Thelephora terrestris TaxID=56493 RepID=A0A9P6L682_9AGAM|nr:hypothetical protein BJ322DRAFT_1219491 [Thelephora terrestris]
MNTHNYPGRGLSIPQLLFALNEELKRVAYSPTFTLEAVSQLDRDASTALATIREWKNSFAHVNLIPSDILSLIPTHLTSQKDRFHAASVCRHWRGVLLKHGALWSQLFLRKGEDYVSTLLKRAKGSALDVFTHRDGPIGTLPLISPRAQQIRGLVFSEHRWRDVITFSELNSGSFPRLRTLEISHPPVFDPIGQPNVVSSPPRPFFRDSVNLERFVFCSWELALLSHFTFPNLTMFKLSADSTGDCSASHLLNFLKASPMLKTVEIDLTKLIELGGALEETVVVLPNVETFSLHVAEDHMTQVYSIAAHISCPSAKNTSLTRKIDDYEMNAGLGIFPDPVSWNTIVRQYMSSPIEEATLKVKGTGDEDVESCLTFRSSDATALRLGFEIGATDAPEDELFLPRAEMGWEIFSQALETTKDHPLLSHVKRLHIEYRAAILDTDKMVSIAEEIQELFNSLGPLDEFTIRGCDLHLFLDPFLDDPVLGPHSPFIFPHTKVLTISHPLMDNERECMNAIPKLAKLQHELGIPFKLVTVRIFRFPVGMATELGRWVDVVDCRREWFPKEDDE